MEFDKRWLDPKWTDLQTVQELKIMAQQSQTVDELFGSDIAFGTAGMRGVMGAGTARMNNLTVRRAAQGVAQCLIQEGGKPSAAIAYDSRRRSLQFAKEAAAVLAANGVKVYVFEELMPTPVLSYAVRRLACGAGIMITASHNTAQYNGFKAYGSDGGQLVAEMAARVQSEINGLDIFDDVLMADYDEMLAKGKIQNMPHQVFEGYMMEIQALRMDRNAFKNVDFSLVYSPLCGAGKRSVTTAFAQAGLQNVFLVEEQSEADGSFKTCPSPNPENPQALTLALALAEDKGADLVLATDPDCDRVAAATREKDGYRLFSGNEMGCLLLDYICACRWEAGTIANTVALKSIVTTSLADKIAQQYGVEMRSLLTGFKYIGEGITELVKNNEGNRFVMGFEESCGYLTGLHVRDKDAVNACLIIAEMCAHYKKQGRELGQVLEGIYKRHGRYHSTVKSIGFEGTQGMGEMNEIMEKLFAEPPTELGGCEVLEINDYRAGVMRKDGGVKRIHLPKSEVLTLQIEDGYLAIRPSGTEPKLKVYCTTNAATFEECIDKTKWLMDKITEIIGR